MITNPYQEETLTTNALILAIRKKKKRVNLRAGPNHLPNAKESTPQSPSKNSINIF